MKRRRRTSRPGMLMIRPFNHSNSRQRRRRMKRRRRTSRPGMLMTRPWMFRCSATARIQVPWPHTISSRNRLQRLQRRRT